MSIKFNAKAQRYFFVAGNNDMDKVELLPIEEVIITVNFESRLPYNNILGPSSVVTVVDELDADKSSNLVSGVVISDDGLELSCRMKASGGTNNSDYMFTFKGVTIPDGQIVGHKILLAIRDIKLLET